MTRVLKTLMPGAPGTLRWLRAHGEHLVCVRYRVDAQEKTRITTVELVVATAPLVHREHPSTWVHVWIARHEQALRKRAVALGASWDENMQLWCLPLGVACELGLRQRVHTRRPRKAKPEQPAWTA
jgi:hypothetical protein